MDVLPQKHQPDLLLSYLPFWVYQDVYLLKFVLSSALKILFVPPEGIEPPTWCLERTRSIR